MIGFLSLTTQTVPASFRLLSMNSVMLLNIFSEAALSIIVTDLLLVIDLDSTVAHLDLHLIMAFDTIYPFIPCLLDRLEFGVWL